jgi:hypothetical protein
MLRRFLVIQLLIVFGVAALAVSAPVCSASAVVRVTSSSGIDRALGVAKAKGPGTTVYFRAGSYSHARIAWPGGINLRGDGIGRTRLDFAIDFGSRSVIGGSTESMGLTIGSTREASEFHLRDGAQRTRFRWVRFRGSGPYLWDICDFTYRWRDRVVRRAANAHDIVWTDCEFEYTGDPGGTTFNVWWDARSGGGNVYNLTWIRCTFGVKNSNGRFGSGRVGMLIQPSPPEHAPDGPRPQTASDPGGIRSTYFGFDFSQVTHGSGQAAVGGANGYGFRIWHSTFVGPASFTSFDLCDYVRAWAMVAHKLKSPNDVSSAMRAAAPDRVTTKGVDLRRVWMAGRFVREYGRHVTLAGVRISQGSFIYHVRAAVRSHDRQLYGF